MPGPFYFAWLEEPVAFGDAHKVEDELVLRAEVTHVEGEFPTCSLIIRNPRRGLLSGPYWAWLSYDLNWVQAQNHTPNIVPLFLGRLIGIPNAFNQDLITLEFTAKPIDYADQLDDVAASLRVLPYFDPIWISPDKWEDPSVVLEAYTKLWHFDRLTHEVTTSDIIVGEDGTEVFDEDDVPADSVQTSIGQAPFNRVSVEANVAWKQVWEGSSVKLAEGLHSTIHGSSIISNWPKPGADLGGGYVVGNNTRCVDLAGAEEAKTVSYSSTWNNPNQKHSPGDTMSSSISATTVIGPIAYEYLLSQSTFTGVGKASIDSTYMYVLAWNLSYRLDVGFKSERDRGEVARFEMRSNIQPILSDESEVHEIKISSNSLDELTADGSLPIGDIKRGTFFDTDRGQYALQYLMNRARAPLVSAARCVEVSFSVPFERAIELSCRMNGIIVDPRLLGGQALGKIKQYSFVADGNSGEMMGSVTLACCIGYGEAVVAEEGEPTYVEAGYVDVGYQQYENAFTVLPSGDFGYIVPNFTPNDDGIQWPPSKNDILIKTEWHIGQEVAGVGIVYQDFNARVMNVEDVQTIQEAADASIKAAEENPTWFEVKLRNLNGKFSSPYNVETITLELPKQIDLEYPS